MHVGCGIIQGNVRCTDNGRTPSFQSSDLELICVRLLLDYFERQHMLCKPPSYVNYENSNLNQWINIQGEGRMGVGGGIYKSVISQSKGGSRL